MTANYKIESKGSTEHHLAIINVIASEFEASLLVGQMEPPVYIILYIYIIRLTLLVPRWPHATCKRSRPDWD